MHAAHHAPRVASSPPPPIRAHRAPDPVPAEDPSPEPFDTPHHQPLHLPQDDDPVPDPNPS